MDQVSIREVSEDTAGIIARVTPFTMPTIKAPPRADAGELIRRLRDEERY